MKVEEYNSEARKAFGKTLIDIGTAIHKAIILLMTVVPITIIFKSLVDENYLKKPILDLVCSIMCDHFFLYLFLLLWSSIAMKIGENFRNAGLKHIHEAEEMKIQKTKTSSS